MLCPFCKNDQFFGHQLVRMDVLVDEDGDYVDSDNTGGNIYDAEKPYGPFTCTKCGAVFEDLNDGEVPQELPPLSFTQTNNICTLQYHIHFADNPSDQFTLYLGLPVSQKVYWQKIFRDTEKACQMLRSQLRGFFASPAGWAMNCKAGKKFSWNELATSTDFPDAKIFHSNPVAEEPIASFELTVDRTELLPPSNVPGVLLFWRLGDIIQTTGSVAVDFRNGIVTTRVPIPVCDHIQFDIPFTANTHAVVLSGDGLTLKEKRQP